MPPLPDSFDLFVAKARECTQPSRQADILFGAMFARDEWFFYNVGTLERPEPAIGEIEGSGHAVMATSGTKLQDYFADTAKAAGGDSAAVRDRGCIAVPVLKISGYLTTLRDAGCSGLLVNPGPWAFTVEIDAVLAFEAQWRAAGGGLNRGFWIPNMTTEEEDFWQEHEGE